MEEEYAPPSLATIGCNGVCTTSSPTVHSSPTILKFVMKYKHPKENETSLSMMFLLTYVERSDARNTYNCPPMYTPQLYHTQFCYVGIS